MARNKVRQTSTKPPSKDADFIALARRRFQQAQDAEKDQRRRELDDLKFYAGEQWPQSVLDARQGSPGNAQTGLPAVPARPCLVIDKIRTSIDQVLNEERHADLAPQLVPADDFGALAGPIDETEIELREGLLRKIMRESEAADAFSWAFSRSTPAGRGYFGVMTRYLPGRTFDQEVFFDRIYNQSSVTLDPAHEQPDGSDAEWAFVGADVPWEQYIAEYPSLADGSRNPSLDSTDADFRARVGDDPPDWFTTEGDGDKAQRYVRVTDYYYTVRERIVYAELPDGTIVPNADVPDGITPRQTRTDVKKQIKWAKIDGKHILEETDWPSPWIPIVKVVGRELHPYDKERRAEGMVRPARSSQVAFNAMVSKQVEVMGYQPLSPFMVAEGQIETYEAWYEQAATRGFPYLPYKQRDLEGNPAGPPIRSSNDTNIQAISQSVSLFSQTIKDTTGVPGPTIGETDPSLRSAAMVKQLVAQSQRGTSNFMDNLIRSLRHGARIVNSLLPTIYSRPGRIAQIITKENQPQKVSMGPTINPNIPGDKNYRLTPNADFDVAIRVVKNSETVRQEEAAVIGAIIEKNPEQMAVYGDLFFKNMDTPGHKEMADRAKAMLAPQVATLVNGQQPIPPEVQQKLQQSGQMIQELTQHVNDLTKQIETKQIEHDTQLQKAHEDNLTKIEIAKIQAGSSLMVADLKATSDQIMNSMKAEAEQLRILLEAAQEERLQRQDHIHEATLTGVEHGHDRMAAAHDTALEMTRAAHEVAITPEPPSPNGSGE